MNGDFNQAGQEYEMLGVAGDPGHYGMLETEAARFFEDLRKHVLVKWANSYHSSEFKRWSATLDCLRSFLYQAQRMASHARELAQCVAPPDHMIAKTGVEVLADFEALLYFGRSALDRLTFAIAKQTYGQACEKFDKLSNVLKNYEKNDDRAAAAKTFVDRSLPEFEGILINNKDGKTGLRSLSLIAVQPERASTMYSLFMVLPMAAYSDLTQRLNSLVSSTLPVLSVARFRSSS